MAVTARNLFAVILLFGVSVLQASDSSDIHDVIGDMAEALTSSDPALAMNAFSKDATDYQKLSDDFSALTSAYDLENNIGITEEDITAATATMNIHWAMTLTARQTNATLNRETDLTVKLTHAGKHWLITSITPIKFFDPQI